MADNAFISELLEKADILEERIEAYKTILVSKEINKKKSSIRTLNARNLRFWGITLGSDAEKIEVAAALEPVHLMRQLDLNAKSVEELLVSLKGGFDKEADSHVSKYKMVIDVHRQLQVQTDTFGINELKVPLPLSMDGSFNPLLLPFEGPEVLDELVELVNKISENQNPQDSENIMCL